MFAVPSFFGYTKTFVSTPVAIAATGVGETSFTANWNAFAGAQYYLFDVSTSPSFSSYVLQNEVVMAPTTSYLVVGLTASTTYYYRVRASTDPYFDPDASAFFARVTAAGGTLTATEQTATNSLVVQMKADGIWTSMKAIYPMVGASAAACAQNLVSASFTGSFTATGWTFASTGVTGNGTSAYMDTQLLASTSLSTSSAHLSVYINTAPNGQQFLANGELSGFLQTSGDIMYGSLGGSFISTAVTTNAAFYMVNRQTSSNLKLIRNATIELNSSNISSAYAANNFLLNAYTTTTFINNCRYAFASIGDGLTDTQASNFYTAVQIFQTTLSRQVI